MLSQDTSFDFSNYIVCNLCLCWAKTLYMLQKFDPIRAKARAKYNLSSIHWFEMMTLVKYQFTCRQFLSKLRQQWCSIHWMVQRARMTDGKLDRENIWFQNQIETLNGQGWLTKNLNSDIEYWIDYWRLPNQLREDEMMRLYIVNITTSNCLATAIMVMFTDWKCTKVMRWLPCRKQEKNTSQYKGDSFSESLAECRKTPQEMHFCSLTV